MLGLLDGLKLAAGAAIGAVSALAYVLVFTLPSARADGAARERVVHEEQRRKAETRREEARRASQAEIDRIEADYLRHDAARRGELAALELALKQEQDDETSTPSPSPGAIGACRPALSRGVSEHLDRIGRTVPGNHPAKPDAALHPRH